MRKNVFLTAIVCMCLTACFKEEPLNAECDIVQAWMHYDDTSYVWNSSDTIVNLSSVDSVITFTVKSGKDLTHLAPQFVITEGATIKPASGSEQDFSNGVVLYTVTSQDGLWHRVYKVGFVEEVRTTSDTIYYDFERVFLYNEKYYTWSDYQIMDGVEANNWATGNGGFALSRSSAKPDEYPTVPLEDGYEGKGVKLTTSDTGAFGKMMRMPIAAGNLFIGKFDTDNALKDAMKSTQFGSPFDKKPVKFTGYYKYKPGDTFKDRYGNEEKDRIDEGAIYAILYKNHDAEGNPVVLYGDNVQTSEQIVAKAIMPEVKPVDEWTEFEIEFDYYEDGIDQETLNNLGYSLTVVFSSSRDGAYFQGAIGSTLCIDKVRIICETTE
ncbi:MAG: PCMD domain-containing protein [Prevotellaceae bacterium]|nr:PCMD domain-containing protein [Prevotellaceae bacterium]